MEPIQETRAFSNLGKTIEYFDSIKRNPNELTLFLNGFPKGGDIHSHLTGTVSPEDYLHLAAKKKLYISIDPRYSNLNEIVHCKTFEDLVELAEKKGNFFVFSKETSEKKFQHPVKEIFYRTNPNNARLYKLFTEKASIRHVTKVASNLFFNTFPNFESIDPHLTLLDYLSPLVVKAENENILYLEVSKGFESNLKYWDREIVENFKDKFPLFEEFESKTYEDKLEKSYEFLSKCKPFNEKINTYLDYINKAAGSEHEDKSLFCRDNKVVVRLNGDVSRELELHEFFVDLTISVFMIEKELKRKEEYKEPRMLGVVVSGDETHPSSIKNRNAQFKMIGYLKLKHENVHFSPHSGEISHEIPDDLLERTIEYAKPSRIGHATCIIAKADKNKANAIFNKLKNDMICLEICLTSNEKILGTERCDHPFPPPFPHLLDNQVPVTLATDDSGVLGNNLATEYRKAVQKYGTDENGNTRISYKTLKDLARNALRHSFLPGEQIFEKPLSNRFELRSCFKYLQETEILRQDGVVGISDEASDILFRSSKAFLQHKLEISFAKFESDTALEFDKKASLQNHKINEISQSSKSQPRTEKSTKTNNTNTNNSHNTNTNAINCSSAYNQITYPEITFGKDKWKNYFGDIGEEPHLPIEIDKVLNEPCPFWPGMKVRETHMLVLIPQKVNGFDLTMKYLGELVQNPKNGGHSAKYHGGDCQYGDGYKDKPRSESYWVLMTRWVLPEMRSKSYSAQKMLIESRCKEKSALYREPHVWEAAICVFMTYVDTGTYYLARIDETHTRCQEIHSSGYPLVVGSFCDDGLYVAWHHCGDASGHSSFGIALVKVFPTGDY